MVSRLNKPLSNKTQITLKENSIIFFQYLDMICKQEIFESKYKFIILMVHFM